MKTVNLLTGRTGDHPAQHVRVFPQLEAVPTGVSVIRGGDALLADGVEHVFISAGGATVSGDPLIIRGGGA